MMSDAVRSPDAANSRSSAMSPSTGAGPGSPGTGAGPGSPSTTTSSTDSNDRPSRPARIWSHLVIPDMGWATMALFGIYYRLTPQAAQGWLPKVHAVLAIGGVAVMVSGLYIVFSGGAPGAAIAGGMMSFASMLIFLFTVVRHGFGAQVASRPGLTGAALTPAE